MDVLTAADRVLRAIEGGQALAGLVSPDFVGDVDRLLPPGPIVLGEPIVRRNLILVGWEAPGASGTWAISLDRQGRILEWSALA